MKALERFLNYVRIDTQSNDTTGTTPSTAKQKNLGRVLVNDLKELGLKDAFMDEYGIVYGHLEGEGTCIGLNAHQDTALEVSGANVRPQVHRNYQGEDIVLNDQYALSARQFPILKSHIGHDLVTTSGDTLLGGDDKSGIAIIMGVLEYLKEHPEVKHHPIGVAFTVDEEIGEGPDHFSIAKMGAEFAYTIDGSFINDVGYINFNAQGVHIHVDGVSVHPGEGKGTLVNAVLVLNELISYLPADDTPYESEEDQGYWHINSVNGTSDAVDCDMILRDFDKDRLAYRGECLKKGQKELSAKYPKASISVTIRDQYENMEPYVKKNPVAVEKADAAIKRAGLTPTHGYIRGGTDGATFSKMGLTTPNLGTGSYNHHGRFEFLDVQEFEKMIQIVTDIVTSD